MTQPSQPPEPSELDQHPAVARVAAAVSERGIACEVVVLDESAHTAALAAEALGIDVAQIANSLVFDADGEPLLVMTSGAHRVDVERVTQLIGATAVRRASPEFVKTHTGQAIGGVAPTGHPRPITTLVDTWLARHDHVWAAAGHARTVFATTYQDLLTLTDGRPADVGA